MSTWAYFQTNTEIGVRASDASSFLHPSRGLNVGSIPRCLCRWVAQYVTNVKTGARHQWRIIHCPIVC